MVDNDRKRTPAQGSYGAGVGAVTGAAIGTAIGGVAGFLAGKAIADSDL